MGGKAFLEILPGSTFPRMDNATYLALKSLQTERLKQYFQMIAVPRAAPEKETHGDLDFVVSQPINGRPTPEQLKGLLGATSYIGGGPAVNFAVPLSPPSSGENQEQGFYQIDITYCCDEAELKRIIFFQSYGDLGMILGLLARAIGLSLGLHGLKVPQKEEYNIEPFLLSDSFPNILEFLGLDFEAWEAGFPSLMSIFEWVASSKWFDPHFVKESLRREQRRTDRKMYHQFLEWVRVQRPAVKGNLRSSEVTEGEGGTEAVEAAKLFFRKKEEYDALIVKEKRRRNMKDNFNGHLVMEWTGLQGKKVKSVMDEVRNSVDGKVFETLSKEEIRGLVLQAKERVYPSR